MGTKGGTETVGKVGAACTASGNAILAIGGRRWRRAALDEALAAARPWARAVEVLAPAAQLAAWQGVARIVEALASDLGSVAPAHRASLDALRLGRGVGDHIGIGTDLRALLAAAGRARPVVLLVGDAHLLDLASAGALSHACSDVTALGASVVIFQAPSRRGVTGLPVVQEHPLDVDECREEPSAPVRTRDDLDAESPMDAAEIRESEGDWGDAALLWLRGGRPDRARRALALADDGAATTEARARLVLATGSMRAGMAEVRTAADHLGESSPTVSARLRVLLVGGALNRGGVDVASGLLRDANQVLRCSEPSASASIARDLIALSGAAVDVADGGSTSQALLAAERPLARLGSGTVDVDAVEGLTALAMPLVWRGELEMARDLLDRVVGALDARRISVPISGPLATSAWLARRQGMLDRAVADGRRALETARATGAVNHARFALCELAHLAAVRGELAACRQYVSALVPAGEPARGPAQLGGVSALAVAEPPCFVVPSGPP